MIERKVFLDTAFAISLSAVNDDHHELALLLSDELEADKTRLVTTCAVMSEIGNSLSRQRYRKAAIELIQSLEGDEMVEIVPMTEDLYARGFDIFQSRPDKVWGITDCISFVVMRELGINSVLTTDRHFQQAGFKALLRKD